MVEKDIPAFLVSKKENQFYLSGFRSNDCDIVITSSDNYLLTDFRNLEAAEEHAVQFQIVETNHEFTLYSFLKELGVQKIAIEEKVLSVSFYRELLEAVQCELVSGDDLVEEIRMAKDELELESIGKAQDLTDLCFSHMLTFIKPGLTELDVALEIELFLRRKGAERLSFETICVSGVRTSLPHGEPSRKVIEKGELITLDFGCVVDGYCSDMTRTVALGHIDKEQKEIYEVVLNAQMAACDALREGVNCSDIDKVARDIINEAGFGKAFGHGTGHGVGLEIHEAPLLNARSKEVLREGMVVTIEPGIYFPQRFGVRIEDLAFVTSSSIINMTKSKKELIIL